ncbi:VC1465 family Xer recombination activation factor [Xanthomonas sp. GW]|uniref:VC1465 family Xer recombination activation factor n=1 Tax=Xanthomonas sp. GW TaxID=2724121 RepID=UPI001639809C|nr:VC1465 family Xer recombination activation factor [Xanthomonas sp. GW]
MQIRHHADRFRTARFTLGLSIRDCAALLRVSVRTVANWEAARSRIPYTAYKLMRVLRGGKLLGPDWTGFQVRGDVLATPEGRELRSSDLVWWSLLVLQAQEFRNIMAQRRGVLPTHVATAMVEHCRAPAWASRSTRSTHCRQSVDTSGDFSPLRPVDTPVAVLPHQHSSKVAPRRMPVGPSSNTGQKSQDHALRRTA